ncbi:ankyrin repeat domain-containing protein [Phycisphaera mikurensis]|uniref:Uncharacterized protein n=1 Tax=Phycisphaera mikurensis (strain NBRC 102666 / KCTC 22515 / FYK2301M01) TaxID=1142394 RepID=I0IFW9_PHYMF|nr:ankyrin repeat domain-containing protein [Phycisphaera mikurensis]MBB6440455.1 ankyrin repeat protein [Phycisphaera mikurensis]BAM04157.1 hypothetical protein PSMK_19980 [Phycisphaera mikurensis NBRC 102666]
MTTIDPATLPKGEPEGGFDEIHLAARQRDSDRVRTLLDSGVSPDLPNRKEPNGDGGNTPLWFAVQGALGGGMPVADVLLAAGAEVNGRCEYGTTPLHMAASWGHLDMVKCLIEHGADPTTPDDEGRTPRQMAVSGLAKMKQDPIHAKTCHPRIEQWLTAMPKVIAHLEACEA